MNLNFTKMHGLGNDFIVLDLINQKVDLNKINFSKLSDRNTGIGFDQALIVEKSNNEADFKYRIFNANGSEVEQCGNGARCFAAFVKAKNLTNKNIITAQTSKNLIILKIEKDNQVTVDMGKPQFTAESVKFKDEQNSLLKTKIQFQDLEFQVCSMGNPHAVITLEKTIELKTFDVKKYGSQIENLKQFQEKTNVEFIKIINKDNIEMRVWERSVGETKACGTGACAVAAISILNNLVNQKVTVKMLGGDLQIQYKPFENLFMTGPASFVFEGSIEI